MTSNTMQQTTKQTIPQDASTRPPRRVQWTRMRLDWSADALGHKALCATATRVMRRMTRGLPGVHVEAVPAGVAVDMVGHPTDVRAVLRDAMERVEAYIRARMVAPRVFDGHYAVVVTWR